MVDMRIGLLELDDHARFFFPNAQPLMWAMSVFARTESITFHDAEEN